MEISMLSLAKMTLYALFLGVGFGLLYDVIRISRVMIGVRYVGIGSLPEKLYEKKWPLLGVLPKREGAVKRTFTDIFVFFGDVLYCTIIGVCFCIFIYYANNGIFRIQSLAASIFGFFCYYQTVGKVLITFAEYICFFTKVFVKILIFAIAFPFKMLYNIFVKVSKKLFANKIRALREKIIKKNTEKQERKLRQLSGEKGKLIVKKGGTKYEKNI